MFIDRSNMEAVTEPAMNFSLYCNFEFGFNQNYFSHEFYLIDLNSFLNVTNMSI